MVCFFKDVNSVFYGNSLVSGYLQIQIQHKGYEKGWRHATRLLWSFWEIQNFVNAKSPYIVIMVIIL